MQLLATEFWEKNNCENGDTCRIQWVVKQCVDYFHSGGQEKAAAKEDKLSRQYFETTTEENLPRAESKLKLIDVGSCYNPFAKFPIFDVTAIDLIPATVDVLKCDFLTVHISNKTKSIENPCSALPRRYFDVVVFSLLLEYLPSSKQRFKCCEKAYELLKPNGLLFILTPDSKHATANSKMMKSWRYALASLGFWRVSYQKLKHLHCMAYRKCLNGKVAQHWLSVQNCEKLPEDLFYIPQDFHEHYDDFEEETSQVRSDVDNKILADTFTSLPDFDIFS